MQDDQSNKTEKIAKELNRNGLTYLSSQQGTPAAFQYFKKAQKILLAECQLDSKNKKIQGLLAVTFNNLAIYYKRTNKPKSALTYLKKALQIQTFSLQDWLATATTHLNICAIYSFMGKHQEAVDHANLSITNAQKAKEQNLDKRNSQKDIGQDKSCTNIELASLYNLAVEYQHLKRYQQAIQTYKRSRENSKILGRKNIQTNSQEAINRINAQMAKNKKKLIQLLQKKRQNQQKGNYESMRRNKKNFKPPENSVMQTKHEKYTIYNNQTEMKKRNHSVNKIVNLQPIRSKSTEGIKKIRQQNSGRQLKKQSSRPIRKQN